MWAKVIAIHVDVPLQEFFRHPIHERMKISLRVELSRDPRLIGDDDERISLCLRMLAKVEDSGCELYLVGPIKIANFAVNNSISI